MGAISAALSAAGLPHELVETRAPGDATERVREARRDGVDCVALVGGDGTVNEAAQAYIDERGEVIPGPELALIPAGTGGDFRKTFDLADDFEVAIERLARAAPRPIDLGVLELVATDGSPVTKAFLNIASFGIGGLTDRIVNESPKWMGGRVAFFVGTLRAMLVYEHAPVRVTVDGEPWFEGPILNVALANGRYFGGGMKIAPEADPTDGRLDVVALHDLDRLAATALSTKIYKGTHIGAHGVRTTRASVVEAAPLRPDDVVLIDLDGETPGRLPIRARLAKGALAIRA